MAFATLSPIAYIVKYYLERVDLSRERGAGWVKTQIIIRLKMSVHYI